MWFCVWLVVAVVLLAAGPASAWPREEGYGPAPALQRTRRQWGGPRNWGYGNFDRNSNIDGDFGDYDGDGDGFGPGDNPWSQGDKGQGDFNFPRRGPSYGFEPDYWAPPPRRPSTRRPLPPTTTRAPPRRQPDRGGIQNARLPSAPGRQSESSRRPQGQISRQGAGAAAAGAAAGASEGKCGVTIEVPRIINGKEAQRGEYPWQAAIIYEKGSERRAFCGGALVRPRWVLTAAHCLDPNTIRGYRLVEVRLGLIDQRRVDEQARSFVPDRQIQHPQYRGGTAGRVRNQNDIALLRLPQATPYTEFIRPVCLPTVPRSGVGGTSELGTTLVVAGWGITQTGDFSNQLMFASVSPVASATCSARLAVAIADSQVCAGGSTTDSCNGDSGGPLVQAAPDERGETVYQVVGLVSFGPTNCATPGTPGAYTRVASFRPWIEQVIREQS